MTDSREVGLRAESYKTPQGCYGVKLHIPSEGLQLLDPTTRAYAFNIFNSSMTADNWPTDMDESDLGTYRLAIGLFKPQKMGYLCISPTK